MGTANSNILVAVLREMVDKRIRDEFDDDIALERSEITLEDLLKMSWDDVAAICRTNGRVSSDAAAFFDSAGEVWEKIMEVYEELDS